MNHYGIGKINSKGGIELPIDLLHPLSIMQNVMVWGMLYPPDYSVNPNPYVKHDLILSPIPFELWGKTTRLVFRTPHKSGVFKRITKLLRKHGASILSSEASRSAYRHDTWSMIVNFDGLVIKTYSEGYKLYEEVIPRITSLKKDLRKLEDEGFFYREQNDEKLAPGFDIYPHHANSYFYSTYQHSKDISEFRGKVSSIHYKPFSFTCDAANVLIPSGRQEFCAALDYLDNDGECPRPYNLFAEMDTIDKNLRVAILGSKLSSRCFSFGASFSRFTDKPDTSAGVTDSFLNALPDGVNVWALKSKTDSFSPDYEKGRLELVLFDEHESVRPRDKDALAIDIVNKANQYLPENITIKEYFAKPIESVFAKSTVTMKADHLKHVFISYSTADSMQANRIKDELESKGIECFLAEKKIKGGDPFDVTIRQALIESYEVIILCSKTSLQSQWVKKESGAAWVLGKRIIPITHKVDIDALPEDLQKFQTFDYSDVVDSWEYPEELATRIFKEYS